MRLLWRAQLGNSFHHCETTETKSFDWGLLLCSVGITRHRSLAEHKEQKTSKYKEKKKSLLLESQWRNTMHHYSTVKLAVNHKIPSQMLKKCTHRMKLFSLRQWWNEDREFTSAVCRTGRQRMYGLQVHISHNTAKYLKEKNTDSILRSLKLCNWS